jgi:hypothetical protein
MCTRFKCHIGRATAHGVQTAVSRRKRRQRRRFGVRDTTTPGVPFGQQMAIGTHKDAPDRWV